MPTPMVIDDFIPLLDSGNMTGVFIQNVITVVKGFISFLGQSWIKAVKKMEVMLGVSKVFKTLIMNLGGSDVWIIIGLIRESPNKTCENRIDRFVVICKYISAIVET